MSTTKNKGILGLGVAAVLLMVALTPLGQANIAHASTAKTASTSWSACGESYAGNAKFTLGNPDVTSVTIETYSWPIIVKNPNSCSIGYFYHHQQRDFSDLTQGKFWISPWSTSGNPNYTQTHSLGYTIHYNDWVQGGDFVCFGPSDEICKYVSTPSYRAT